jgi:site-specific DNA recombinase
MTNAIPTETHKEVVARGKPSHDLATVADGGHRYGAVAYLRVSTAGQASTDRDGEAFSLAAQREACIRKAESLNADVLDIYVDAGESARKADRPQLQAMLERLKAERDADFVIVHKIDRLARNRGDDVAITFVIQQAGAQLVSVTENIDETPAGMLLHGIMSSMAEFYSQNLASEINKGTLKKAQTGVFPGLAPIGYVNRQDLSGGKKQRWIETDPERAPLVRWAFEAYASGDYTINQLTESLAEQGLATRGTPKRPAKPLVVRHVHNLLRNRFYLGRFTWADVEYEGSHEPLVSIETFATVQAIMHSRRQVGDKPQKHPHYLKGTVFCGKCESRMLFSRNKGRRGGSYDYFVCLGRHTYGNGCDLPYASVRAIEDAVEDYYRTITLGEDAIVTIRDQLLTAAQRRNASAERMARRDRKRILNLEAERRKLLQAHLAGAVPLDLLKEEQERLRAELANAGVSLANTEVHWEVLEANVTKALNLVTRLDEAYRHAGPNIRRYFNQAILEGIYIDVDGGIAYARLAEPFKSFLDNDFLARLTRELTNPGPGKDRGSNMSGMVEVKGLEPSASTLRIQTGHLADLGIFT